MTYEKIYYYYNTIVNGKRLWPISWVRNAVVKKHITKAQYKEITGEDYPD